MGFFSYRMKDGEARISDCCDKAAFSRGLVAEPEPGIKPAESDSIVDIFGEVFSAATYPFRIVRTMIRGFLFVGKQYYCSQCGNRCETTIKKMRVMTKHKIK